MGVAVAAAVAVGAAVEVEAVVAEIVAMAVAAAVSVFAAPAVAVVLAIVAVAEAAVIELGLAIAQGLERTKAQWAVEQTVAWGHLCSLCAAASVRYFCCTCQQSLRVPFSWSRCVFVWVALRG